MEIGILIRFGKIVPGREDQAMELWGDAGIYYQGLVAEGRLTYFEPFLFMTSDIEQEMGFHIIKGSAPEIFRLFEEERFTHLAQKGMLLLEHFQVDLLNVGEAVVVAVERFGKVRAELGI